MGTPTVVELWRSRLWRSRSHCPVISLHKSPLPAISLILADTQLVAKILETFQESQTDCVGACVTVI